MITNGYDWTEFEDIEGHRYSLRANTIKSIVDHSEYYTGDVTLEDVSVIGWGGFTQRQVVVSRKTARYLRKLLDTLREGGS